MPIPILLVGLGVAAGVVGAGGHLSAKDTNERAQRISQNAQDLYNEAKYSLEQAQNKTEKALLELGYSKKNILDTSMSQFLNSYDKIKHIQAIESISINEISKFAIDQQGAIEMREMIDIYSSSIKSGVTGTVAGAVIALAASGSLSVVTGGLATAGSVLLAGEVSAAAGIAGSALSFAAAMTPLVAVAAPVILFTGISASMKADENLEKANTMYAQAKAASEKMRVSKVLCDAISEKSEIFNDLLLDLNVMFSECSSLLAGIISKKEGKIFKKKLTSQDFTEEDLKLIAVTRALAGAVKSIIDTPILSKDGNINYESENIYEQTVEKLPDFNQVVDEVKQIECDVKPIKAKVSTLTTHTKIKSFEKVALGGARNILAFLIAFFFSIALGEDIASAITLGSDKFLFLDSFTANKIAVWLVVGATVIMFIGKLKNTKLGTDVGTASAIGLFILYVQFCRTVEKMSHYIIFSVIVIIILASISSFLEKKKNSWDFILYISNMVLCLMIYPILFLIYAFFCKFLDLSESLCLIVTSILMFLSSLGIMRGMDNS